MATPIPRHRSIAMCLTLSLIVSLVGLAGIAAAEDKPAASSTGKSSKAAPTPEEQMAEMMKLGMPGPQHEMMKKCEGTWKAVTKSWEGPGDPKVSEGSAEFKMVLDGRFLEERYHGTMMNQPFEGYGLTGYDNMKKAYSMLWADNSQTSMMLATGSYDEAKKMLTFKAPMAGMDGKPTTARMTLEFPNDNTQLFTMYATQKGKESKMVEITYSRE